MANDAARASAPLRTFRATFSVQNFRSLESGVQYLRPGWLCQKQSWTTIRLLSPRIAKSGRPDSRAECRWYRRLVRRKYAQTCDLDSVFSTRILPIIRERVIPSTKSLINIGGKHPCTCDPLFAQC